MQQPITFQPVRQQSSGSIRSLGLVKLCFFLVALPVLLVSCGPKNPPPPPPPPPDQNAAPENLEHRVTYVGESLGAIALWYTGKISNWQILRDANPSLKKGRLTVGQTILVPGGLVIRREAMPKRALADYAAKSKKAPRPPADQGSTSNRGSTTPPPAPPPSVGDTRDQGLGTSDPAAGRADPAAGRTVKPNPIRDEPLELPGVSHTAEPPVSPPAVAPPPSPAAAPEKSPDTEREKLLDELLTQ